MHMTRALNLLLGRFTRQFLLRRYLPLVYGVLFGCFVIADILFPPDPVTGGPGYIPFLRTISGQGNHGDNPAGAWFFVAGLVITSVLLVPFNAYAWRRFAAACKGTATFAGTSSRSCSRKERSSNFFFVFHYFNVTRVPRQSCKAFFIKDRTLSGGSSRILP